MTSFQHVAPTHGFNLHCPANHSIIPSYGNSLSSHSMVKKIRLVKHVLNPQGTWADWEGAHTCGTARPLEASKSPALQQHRRAADQQSCQCASRVKRLGGVRSGRVRRKRVRCKVRWSVDCPSPWPSIPFPSCQKSTQVSGWQQQQLYCKMSRESSCPCGVGLRAWRPRPGPPPGGIGKIFQATLQRAWLLTF